MKLFDKVCIIGVGLIGGSVALGFKKNKLCRILVGVSRSRRSILLAKKRKAIDSGSQDISLVKDADLVVLATPVMTTLKLAPLISRMIKKNCIVIDVGSTKKDVVMKLDRIFPEYIGTHPLAGSEKRGVTAASASIFKDSVCILTPTKNTKTKTLAKIKKMWIELGAKIVVMPAGAHDKTLALLSHLPHVVAFSLIRSIPEAYLRLAPNSLKDMTRIAASESELWSDIFLSNKENIIRSIKSFQTQLDSLRLSLNKEDRVSLVRILKNAKTRRQNLE